jgi:uncharacterized membrane protein
MSGVVTFRPTSRFDRVFEVGILLKDLDGLLEIIGAISPSDS